jgi:hypothetical protein
VEAGKTKDPGPRFLVRYRVLPSGTTYTKKSENELPAADRQVFIGIHIDFDFTLQVPGAAGASLEDDPEKGHRFSMTAKPPMSFSVSGRSAGDHAVYDQMAETAFNEFEQKLVRAYGFGAPAR